MESGEEDDAFIMGERDWQKMNRTLTKEGYREGRSEGREKGMQASFEFASGAALKHALRVGELHGAIEWSLASTTQRFQRKNLEDLQAKVTSHLETVKCSSIPHDYDNLIAEWEKSLLDLNNEFQSFS